MFTSFSPAPCKLKYTFIITIRVFWGCSNNKYKPAGIVNATGWSLYLLIIITIKANRFREFAIKLVWEKCSPLFFSCKRLRVKNFFIILFDLCNEIKLWYTTKSCICAGSWGRALFMGGKSNIIRLLRFSLSHLYKY